ncbi:hypothetical protein G4D82_10305 [Flavobacterium sp. CYK-4]|uniref:hypothetical protein n=1 Tax=Flavobacterium lotistagni TaxID=2709660 RepID=UPI00140A9FB2|nr:hypothetical protein [Flavobacterium lotistagni]NHM07614.1 hypothetical protein [Flavobacterium lotistagni]
MDTDIRSFKRSVLLRALEKFEVVAIKPKASIEETIAEIFDSSVDAVVADFRLSEEDPTVHYNGSDVIKGVIEVRAEFPVFILTSFEDDAIDKGFDVNIVYEKKDIQESPKFFEKVITQIKKHIAKIENAEIRIKELIIKRQTEPLTLSEEEELIELDALVEKSLDKRNAIPPSLKANTNAERLNTLIEKTDALINEIKSKKNE